MSTLAQAIYRFNKIERVRTFPTKCERCTLTFNLFDEVSVLKLKGGTVLVTHKRCKDGAKFNSNEEASNA